MTADLDNDRYRTLRKTGEDESNYKMIRGANNLPCFLAQLNDDKQGQVFERLTGNHVINFRRVLH